MAYCRVLDGSGGGGGASEAEISVPSYEKP